MVRGKKRINEPDDSSASPAVRIEVELDDVIALTFEYDSAKLRELLKALLHYGKNRGAFEYNQNSLLTEFNPNYKHWSTQLVVGPDDLGGYQDVLSWCRTRTTIDESEDEKHYEYLARQAESFIHWVISFVLHSIPIPLIMASFLDAQGQAGEALQHLIDGLQTTLLRELGESKEERTEHLSKNLVQSISLKDDHGGSFDCTYDYTPMVKSLIQQIKAEFFHGFEHSVSSEITEKGIADEQAEELRRHFYNQRDRIIRTYALVGARLFIDGLPAILKESLTQRMQEAIYEAHRELKEIVFKDEKGEWIEVRSDLAARLNKLLTKTEARTKERVKAPRRGGANRDPEFDWTDEDARKQFIKRVNKLRPLWEKALNEDDEIRWGDGWPAMLKRNKDFAEISIELLEKVVKARTTYRDRGDPILPDYSPFAYALKQAAQEQGITKKKGKLYAFGTLRKYHAGTLPAMKRNKK